MLMDAVTGIVKWFGDLFDKITNFDFASIAKSIMPAKLYDWIFGGGQEVSEAAKKTVAKAEASFTEEGSEKSRKDLVKMGLLDEDWWNKDNLELEKIQEVLKGQQTEGGGLTDMGKNMIAALTQQLGDTDIAEGERQKLSEMIERAKGTGRNTVVTALQKQAEQSHTGSILNSSGLIMAQKGQVIVDDLLVKGLQESIALLTNSQALERAKMGNGSPVIINQVDNSQRNPVVSNQATQIKVPDNPRPSDPTMLAVQGSQMFN